MSAGSDDTTASDGTDGSDSGVSSKVSSLEGKIGALNTASEAEDSYFYRYVIKPFEYSSSADSKTPEVA